MAQVAALSVGRRPLLHAYQRVLVGDPPGSPIQTDPITGDIELTYRYPDYMHRDPRTLSGTGGDPEQAKEIENRSQRGWLFCRCRRD